MMKGMICLWFGLINAIPDGWLVCDGTNNTPDLRNRFVIGAGDTYNPDDTGGALTHNHDDTYQAGVHLFAAGTSLNVQPNFANSTLISSDSFTTTTDSGTPPYHALAYIMKEG